MSRLSRQSTLYASTRDVEDHGGVRLRPHHRTDERYLGGATRGRSSSRGRSTAVEPSTSPPPPSVSPRKTRSARKKSKRADTPAPSRAVSRKKSAGKSWAATHDVRGASLTRNYVGDAKMLTELRSHDFDEQRQHDGRELRTEAHVNYDETAHRNTHPASRRRSASGGAHPQQTDYHASGTRLRLHTDGASAGARIVAKLTKIVALCVVLVAALFAYAVHRLATTDRDHWLSRRCVPASTPLPPPRLRPALTTNTLRSPLRSTLRLRLCVRRPAASGPQVCAPRPHARRCVRPDRDAAVRQPRRGRVRRLD